MASAALLFAFSAVVFLFVLLQAPAAAPGHAVADLLASALDRFFLDGRGVLELATRRNMILLCHAILLLILRDAGLLAGRRSRSSSPPSEASSVAVGTEIIACSAAAPAPARAHVIRTAVIAQTACSAVPVPVPARTHATRSAVVWRRRRPRNRAVVAPAHEYEDAAGRVVDVECRPVVEAAATWATPLLTRGPPPQAVQEATAVATKQIVLAESPRNDDDGLLDRHDRAAVVEPLEDPTAIADDGETDCDDRRIIAVADDDTAQEQQTAGMEMELADDRTFEEFIESQKRQMRQESLRLVRSAYHNQAIAACY